MNRCASHWMIALTLLPASASLFSSVSRAQTSEINLNVRKFPPAALRGEMVVIAPPLISIDGKPDRLSVGSRIRDPNNFLVLSGALVNQNLVVNYLREPLGQVHQVWILNSEEAREKRPNATSSLFNFGSDATTAPTDDGKTPFEQLPTYQP